MDKDPNRSNSNLSITSVVGADDHIGPHTAVRIRRKTLQIHNISLPGRCGHRPLQSAFLDLKQLDKPKFEEQ